MIILQYNFNEKGPITIKVGTSNVTQETNAKLLGINIDENLDWKTQISGQGGMVSALNSRLFLIKRLSNYISKKRLMKVADSLYTSKIRYGIQLMGKVRTTKEDPTNSLLKKVQVAQNKFARFMAGKSLIDKINTEKILSDIKLLSVNQLNAHIKLQEVWKAQNNKNYPTQWVLDPKIVDARKRSVQKEALIVDGKGLRLQSTFYSDAANLWNKAPDAIKKSLTIYSAKSEIKKYILTLPI